MIVKRLLVLFSVAAALSAYSQAQLWSGILAPSRAIDWSQAGAGLIPNRTSICSTLNPGATASQINTAIANCSSSGGGVVMLSAGTYSGMGGINLKSNVTLRGAGPDATFLVFTSGTGCNGLGAFVCVDNGDDDYPNGGVQNRATWTGTNGNSGTYTQGATTLILGAVSKGSINNLHIGSNLILDQDQDYNTDPGDIYVSDSSTVIQLSGHTGCGDVMGAPSNGQPRVQTQTVQVTSISGTGPWTVGITPAVYAPNWRGAMNPGAWWPNHVPITGVGIESLSLDYSAGPHESGGIFFADAANSWVKNVRSINGTVDKHVRMYQSRNLTVRDSYFYGGTGTSENYGVDDGFHSSNNLVENNIFQHMATATIAECSSGSVFGYNYAVDNNYISSTNWQQQDATKHGAGEHYELWEGQIGAGMMNDDLWGTSFMQTVFRNRWSGRDRTIKTQQTIAINDYARNRYMNVVGNVLGTAGYHTVYTSAPTSATSSGNSTSGDLSVFVVGFSGNDGTIQSSTVTNDLPTVNSLMRWGNFDTVNNAVRWVASETGSNAVTYPGLSAPSQSLPASFYLSARPSWWGSMPWPAIGPDVTGGNVSNVGGHAYLTPAASCYLNVLAGLTDGTTGILTFNANKCYTSSVNLPAPPTNVTVVVN